jgi:tryptophan synthase alpha chain
MTQLPIVIGFGIKDADSAKAMGALADGVIIGSALVERVAELGSSSAAELTASTAVIREARAALEQL